MTEMTDKSGSTQPFKARVGLRRLFRSRGVSFLEGGQWEDTFDFGGVDVAVTVGPRPSLGVYLQTHIKYLDEQSGTFGTRYELDATKLPEAGSFFTEIRCSREIEVDPGIVERFWAKEQAAQDVLFQEGLKYEAAFKETADLVAGVIGLRFHRQLVLELINENAFVQRRHDDTPTQLTTPWMEILDRVVLRPEARAVFQTALTSVGRAPVDARRQATVALQWLVRAWEETNPVTKFLSLFIPIEWVLQGVGDDPAKVERRAALVTELGKIVTAHGGPNTQAIKGLVAELESPVRPGLVARFERLARAYQFPGWEDDIKAFRQFNKARNGLLHRGSMKVILSYLEPGALDTERQGLEDLAERYVGRTYFGDALVYPSRWRRMREGGASTTNPHD